MNLAKYQTYHRQSVFAPSVKMSHFPLIKLPVSKTCQICVSRLYYFRKSTSLFGKEQEGAGKRENFSLSPAHSHFTLIELLVVTSQLCRDFFKRFICTDQYGDGLFKIKPIFEFF